MNIRTFREIRGLRQTDIVTALRRWYAGLDTTLISKVEDPQKYGIQLLPEAELELQDIFKLKEIVEEEKKDRHKFTGRVQARMAENKKHDLLIAFKEDGFRDMNAGLNHLITMYLTNHYSYSINKHKGE